MKKMIALLAVVAITAPALAEPTQRIVIPKGSYTIEPAPEVEPGVRHDPNNLAGIYNNLQLGHTQTQYVVPNQGNFVGDDLHMVGTEITGIRWVYSDPGTGSHTSTAVFLHNTAGDAALGSFVYFPYGTQTYPAAFLITGLPNATPNNPGGGWLITVGLPSIPTGNPDIWMGLNSNSTTAAGTRGLRGTNLTPNNPAGNEGVGNSHNLHFATSTAGTSFFTVPNGGSFRMAVLPEPAIAAMMALGGVLALRRRRA